MDDITLHTIDLAVDTVAFAGALILFLAMGASLLKMITGYAGLI